MKTWFVLLSALICCCTAIADDAVNELSKHIGKTPALVVVVCGPDQGDYPLLESSLQDGALDAEA